MASDSAKSFITGFANQTLKQIEEAKASASKEYDRTQELVQSLQLEEYKTRKQKRDRSLEIADRLQAAHDNGDAFGFFKVWSAANGMSEDDINARVQEFVTKPESMQAMQDAFNSKAKEAIDYYRTVPKVTFSTASLPQTREEAQKHAALGTGLFKGINALVGGTITRQGNPKAPEEIDRIVNDSFGNPVERGPNAFGQEMARLGLTSPVVKDDAKYVTVNDQLVRLKGGKAEVVFDGSSPDKREAGVFTQINTDGSETPIKMSDLISEFKAMYPQFDDPTTYNQWKVAHPQELARLTAFETENKRQYTVYDFARDKGVKEFLSYSGGLPSPETAKPVPTPEPTGDVVGKPTTTPETKAGFVRLTDGTRFFDVPENKADAYLKLPNITRATQNGLTAEEMKAEPAPAEASVDTQKPTEKPVSMSVVDMEAEIAALKSSPSTFRTRERVKELEGLIAERKQAAEPTLGTTAYSAIGDRRGPAQTRFVSAETQQPTREERSLIDSLLEYNRRRTDEVLSRRDGDTSPKAREQRVSAIKESIAQLEALLPSASKESRTRIEAELENLQAMLES